MTVFNNPSSFSRSTVKYQTVIPTDYTDSMVCFISSVILIFIAGIVKLSINTTIFHNGFLNLIIIRIVASLKEQYILNMENAMQQRRYNGTGYKRIVRFVYRT